MATSSALQAGASAEGPTQAMRSPTTSIVPGRKSDPSSSTVTTASARRRKASPATGVAQTAATKSRRDRSGPRATVDVPTSRTIVPSGAREATVADAPGVKPWVSR